MSAPVVLSREIRERARTLGFVRVGFSPAERSDGAGRLRDWLANRFQGSMGWMERGVDRRSDPRELFPGVRTVISAAISYLTEEPSTGDPQTGSISRYAWGEDYHRVVKEKLDELLDFIKSRAPAARGKVCVDTSAVLEKTWAARAGVGWQGKHSNTIVKDAGCWVFLGEILLNQELEYDQPAVDHCGSCTRCIDACPTDAIVAPYVVDSRLCISYLNIELRGSIPEPLRPKMGNRIYGCDDCQEVCPWKKFRKDSPTSRFAPAPENRSPLLGDLASMTRDQFRERFRHSAVTRVRYEGFLRNVAVALGNAGSPEALPPLRRLLEHESPLVRSHAAWALGRIGSGKGRQWLREAADKESDPEARLEIQKALGSVYNLRTSPHSAGEDRQDPGRRD